MVAMTDVGNARGWLSPEAAASLRRIDARLGKTMPTSELGRTWERAQYLWDLYFYPNGSVRPASTRPTWLGRPGRPATSPHVTGDAGDSDHWPGWEHEHGWIEDVPGEPWHRRYIPSRDRFLGQPASVATPTPDPIEGEPMLILIAEDTKGWLKKGMALADTLTSPLTVITQAELDGLEYWAGRGVPYRKAVWPADKILALVKQRGVRPQEGPSGRAAYDKADY